MQELNETKKTEFTETPPAESGKGKLPAWAILIAVLAFVAFNAFFLVFAMQIGSETAN